jgi:hypothetical protein
MRSPPFLVQGGLPWGWISEKFRCEIALRVDPAITILKTALGYMNARNARQVKPAILFHVLDFRVDRTPGLAELGRDILRRDPIGQHLLKLGRVPYGPTISLEANPLLHWNNGSISGATCLDAAPDRFGNVIPLEIGCT